MTTEIQVMRGGRSMGLTPQSMIEAVQLAEYAAKSGLCAVREPAQALVVLLTGMELGLSPMQSFRGIHVVNGKPVLSADLLVAIVRSSGVCKSWLTLESSIDRCTIETHRDGDAAPVRKTWTMEDARRAGLSTAVWRSYPAQMLRHRCAADLAREVYSDLALGLYTPDEVSDGRVSDADVGTVTVVREDAPAQPAPLDALDAFRRVVAECTDLATIAAAYQGSDLGGTSAKAVADVVRERTAKLGYHLNAADVTALLGGSMPAGTALAYDRLACVTRHADDEDGDSVVAEVVRVLRDVGGLDAPTRIKTAAVATCTALDVSDAAKRIAAALRPTPPNGGPGGGQRTLATQPTADATAAPQATGAANDAAPAMRVEHTAEELAARILRADDEGAAAWREHLAATVAEHAARGADPRFALAQGYAKRRFLFTKAGGAALAMARESATVDEMVAHGGDREWNTALIASKCTRSPALGATVRVAA